MNAALEPLLDLQVDGATKGFPQARRAIRLGDVGRQGWRLLSGDLDTPVAVLKASALQANEDWMAQFVARAGAGLCPHGKTSMAPQLFHRQIARGAWGITLATVQQVRIAWKFGVERVLLANELVAEGAIAWIQETLDANPSLDFTCLVDSLEGVRRLDRLSGRRPINVLLELGIPSGRTGARDEAGALEVARAVRRSPRLRLRGVECFEGIVMSQDAALDQSAVVRWLDGVGQLALKCQGEALFETDEVLLTAGGSAYFDLVAAKLSGIDLRRASRVLLRSGCYLFHDVGHYARLLARLEGRLSDALRPRGHFQPAIEIWGRVLSRPEPGLAFLDFGKRDVSHDIDLPRPLFWARPGAAAASPAPGDWKIVSLYDQHARVQLPKDAELAVGDLVGCGISHPCTTLDKWQLLLLVDDDYRVVEGIRTFF